MLHVLAALYSYLISKKCFSIFWSTVVSAWYDSAVTEFIPWSLPVQIRTCPLVALALALFAFAPAPAQIYVSPTGNDANPGTLSKPIQTLDHARALARTAQQKKHTGDLHIWLAGGTYRLSEPLLLTADDSGTEASRILYAAMPGQHPIVSGGLQVKGWKLIDASRNLWSAPAPEQVTNVRQLYIDGVRASRTRGRLPIKLTETPTGYTASDATISAWKNPADMELVYTGGNGVWSEPSVGLGSWTEPRCPIAAIGGATITMQQPCWDNSTQRVMLPSGARTANLVGPKSVGKQPTYIENAFELLGTPGQFYFDRTAHVIYYTPRHGENLRTADVELPFLQKLIDGQGTASAPIHDIAFSGIQFSYAAWLGASGPDGFSEIQAGYQVTGPDGYSKQGLCKLVPDGACPYGAWTKEPGNVAIAFAHNISFTRDAFVHLGAAGLDLGDGAQHCTVEGSVFTDISGNGVQLGGVDAPLAPIAEQTGDNRIDNNLFENVGAEFRGGIGIVVGYAQRTSIDHNQLDHTPYATISIGWGGWPDKIQQAGQANYSNHNVIANNLIHNFMQVLSDGGGIYTQGRTGKTLDDGERVAGNVIYNQYSTGHAIYTDNGSSMITVDGNVIFHTNHDNWGSRHRDFYDGLDGKDSDPLTIENNYWQQGDRDSSKGNVTESNNRLINALTEAPATLIQAAGLRPQYRDITKLTFSKPSAPEAPNRVAAWAGDGYALVTWCPSVFSGTSPVTTYTVTASTGAHATISSDDLWKMTYIKVPGLTNGAPVTFTVTAGNAVGTSPQSLPAIAVTPGNADKQLPQAPAGVSVDPGAGGKVSIHFQLPPTEQPENLASPVIAYVIKVEPSGRKVTFTGRNVTALEGKHATFNVVDGLTPGTAYTFSVSAVNTNGEGTPTVIGPITLP